MATNITHCDQHDYFQKILRFPEFPAHCTKLNSIHALHLPAPTVTTAAGDKLMSRVRVAAAAAAAAASPWSNHRGTAAILNRCS
ncbi:hypothetical protein JOB18_006377 [Solea senegalensis]|uniref:Uncharacterized protein n=1 Tax=Solea senegalensis TaxID=28829 RepID=A0AAV6SC42_SOLSE|nr:hypothetical protein JOB18_006377 [Solea senegalensis]